MLPAWQVTKVKGKKEVIEKAQKEGRTVHFVTLMDNCHLKNSEMEPKFSKCKGRVVLRADVVMDDSGSYAVFTERRSAVKRIVAPPQINTVWRPRTKCRHFEQESRSARRLAPPTDAGRETRRSRSSGAVRGKVGGVCGGARSQRSSFAPTYFFVCDPCLMLSNCAMLEVP